ncbi:MAG TPA: hypothetical protein VMV59_06510 [Candidatus Dormibacteraeota bacterium]|nr:hypothetical protein [Candidatus Dormibacteraeota bacterium]
MSKTTQQPPEKHVEIEIEPKRNQRADHSELNHPWSKEDRITYIEGRLTELRMTLAHLQQFEASGHSVEAELHRVEREIEKRENWLLIERDGLTWGDVAKRKAGEQPRRVQSLKSQVRRDWEAVERSHPGSGLYKLTPEPIRVDCCLNCGFPLP